MDRHWHDAELLRRNERLANAGHLAFVGSPALARLWRERHRGQLGLPLLLLGLVLPLAAVLQVLTTIQGLPFDPY